MSPVSARKYTLLALAVVTPLGFWFKYYRGPVSGWFNDYGAGLLYEVFWILVVFLIIPKKDLVNTIPVWVFFATCFLEILQLWHPPVLERIRSYFLGKALIGTSFAWLDFLHYVIGCTMGWLLLKRISHGDRVRRPINEDQRR